MWSYIAAAHAGLFRYAKESPEGAHDSTGWRVSNSGVSREARPGVGFIPPPQKINKPVARL
jgi:hypothetical protein